MTRVDFPPVEMLSEEYRTLLANRPPLNLYRMLPRTGALARHFLAMGEAIRTRLSLSPSLREIAIVRVGVRTGADYEVHHHSVLARKAGVSAASLAAAAKPDIGASPRESALATDEALVIRYVDALIDTVRADDALFAQVEAMIGTDAVAELTMVVGFYLLVSRFLTNFDIQIEGDLDHDEWV
jgi:4-carboxymuconolactone decarboxylase